MAPIPVSALARRATLSLLGTVGAFETNPDGSWDFVSPAFCEMLGGLPASSLLGREWIKRVHPEDLQRTLAEYRQAREFGRPWIQRVRMLGADSVPVWVSFNAFPLPSDSHSRGVMLIGVAKDTSAEVRAQQIARESAETISALADFYAEGLVIMRDSYVIAANDAASKMHRCRPEDLVGRSIQSLVAPGDEPRFATPPDANGETFMTGRMLRVGDGTPVLIAVHGRPIMYAGAPARIVSFVPVNDPHIQAALEDRNFRRLQSLESLLPFAYHRVSIEGDDFGTIEYANAHFAALIGRTPEEIIGHNVLDFTHPSHVDASRSGMARMAQLDGRQGSILRRFVTSSGECVELVLDVSIYRDPVTGHAVSMSLSRSADSQDPATPALPIR